MQKFIFVENYQTSEINSYLNNGWNVISVTPIIKCVASNHDKAVYGAYVVIERD